MSSDGSSRAESSYEDDTVAEIGAVHAARSPYAVVETQHSPEHVLLSPQHVSPAQSPSFLHTIRNCWEPVGGQRKAVNWTEV